MNITLDKVPCSVVHFDIHDVLGTQLENVKGNALLTTISRDGSRVAIDSYTNISTLHSKHIISGMKDSTVRVPEYEAVKKAFIEEQGCLVTASFKINKV